MKPKDPRSYEFALDVFRAVHGLTKELSTEADFELAQTLHGLQPVSRQLWESYRTGTTIDVQYSDDVCDAYLLRYFPPYSRILRSVVLPVILESRRHLPRSEGAIRCCILGGGPAPELASLHSLQQFLNALDVNRRIDLIDALIIDHHGESWERITKAVASRLNRLSEGPKVSTTTVEFALTDPDWVEQAASDLARSHLLIIQNVLNEIDIDQWPAFIDLLEEAVALLPDGSIIVIADLKKHGVSQNRFQDVCNRLKNQTLVKYQGDKKLNVDKPGGLIGYHLLNGDDGLIPRTNVEISSAVLERQTVRQESASFDVLFKG
jgi:hypothetical protein